MKSIYDLSWREIVELSDEQVEVFVKREFINENIPIDVLSRKEVEIEEPETKKCYDISLGYSSSISFDKIEDAIEVKELIAKKKGFVKDYAGSINDKSFYVKRKKADLRVFDEVFTTEEEIKRVRDINERIEKNAIGEAIKNKAYDIRRNVFKHVDDVKFDYSMSKEKLDLFIEYVELAEGNAEKAYSLFEKSVTITDITKELIVETYPQLKELIFKEN